MDDKNNKVNIIIDECSHLDPSEWEKMIAFIAKRRGLRATGGGIYPRAVFWCSSPGPELFVGGQSGSIIPIDKDKGAS